MKTARKVLLVVLCAALLVGASVAGTLAFLQDKTKTVTNTFTIGNINLALVESWNFDSNGDSVDDAWQAKLVPGTDVAKDPVVKLTNTTEPCWVFVKVEEQGTTGISFGAHGSTAMIQYGINTTKWTKLDGVDGVYYHKVDNPATDNTWYVLTGTGTDTLKDGYVHISDGLTKETIDGAGTNPTITLSFTAYAIQQEGFTTANDAWTEVSKVADAG